MNNKNNHKKMDFKLISTKVLLLCLLLAFGSSKAFSQCNYVTTENGKETKLSIPCDFPVKVVKPGAADTEQTSFDMELGKWFASNPKFKNIVLTPIVNTSINSKIEISISEYRNFILEKKKVIDAFPDFYKIVKNIND